jgi:hypothetical protein
MVISSWLMGVRCVRLKQYFKPGHLNPPSARGQDNSRDPEVNTQQCRGAKTLLRADS